jgi:hypothetical protein
VVRAAATRPASTLSGFSLKYTQEFTGGSTPANWNLYTGVPGGETSQEAQWIPSMCTFSGGEVHFMASGIDSCGMDYQGGPQEYGAWFARLKAADEPAGELFSDIFLLWPANATSGRRRSTSTAQPALPMEMALQSQNLQGSPGSASHSETMTVDWVEQFGWNG